MNDYTTSINSLIQRSVDSIIESIAMDGVDSLVHILENEGFSKNEYLKDYKVFAHVISHEIWFEILLSIESIDDDSVEKLDEDSEENIPKNATTFVKGKFGLVSKLLSYKDARRDARTHIKDARRDARKRPTGIKSHLKTSQIRDVLHDLHAHAPRSMIVDSHTKRISLRMKSLIQERAEDSKSEKFTYKKQEFDGIIGKFIDDLMEIISEKFSGELQKVILRYLS